MKIRPVGAELFFAGGRKDGRTDRRTGGRTDGRKDRRTDRHDEANSRFSQFCERAYTLNISLDRYLPQSKGKVIPLQARCGPEGG